MSATELQGKYDRIKSECEVLAGGIGDIPQRVAILTNIYLDSGGNHEFSLMAAHGALWARGYFESGGTLGRLTALRYFYSPQERGYRIGILREFSEAFRAINRLVCIDTYANYLFTKLHGESPGADEVVPQGLLEVLNRVHHASRLQQSLTNDEKAKIFEQSFHCEQEITVAPGVAKAVAEFECPIMRWLCLHPIVRFAYFPRLRYICFRDFSSKDERIAKGMSAYVLAQRMGWERVRESMKFYGQMPGEFFADPAAYLAGIKASVLRSAEIARSMAD